MTSFPVSWVWVSGWNSGRIIRLFDRPYPLMHHFCAAFNWLHIAADRKQLVMSYTAYFCGQSSPTNLWKLVILVLTVLEIFHLKPPEAAFSPFLAQWIPTRSIEWYHIKCGWLYSKLAWMSLKKFGDSRSNSSRDIQVVHFLMDDEWTTTNDGGCKSWQIVGLRPPMCQANVLADKF